MRKSKAELLTALGLVVVSGVAVWVSRARDVDQLSPEPVAAVPEFEPAPIPVMAVAPERTKNPVLTPAPLEAMQDDIGEKRAAKKEWDKAAFVEEFDADGDGELSKEEWAVAKQSSPQEQKNPRLQALLGVLNDRYDTDGDGELSPDERQVLNREFGAAKRQIASDITPRYDLDGDGRLTGEEKAAAGPDFRAAFERLGAFALLDNDGSWDIDPTELAMAIMAVTEGDELMDFNGDGKVDYEDAILAADIASSGG